MFPRDKPMEDESKVLSKKKKGEEGDLKYIRNIKVNETEQ